MSEITGGRYIGLERELVAIAHRAHNAHVPADTQGDVCTCANCQSSSARALPREPETGPAVASPLPPAGPVSIAAIVERESQDRLREQDEAERAALIEAPPSCLQCIGSDDCASADVCAAVFETYRSEAAQRGPVQDESVSLDPVDAAALRAIEGPAPMAPVSQREIGV